MNLGFVTNLTILANTGHGAERSLFEEIAKRWEAGQWGMYPIAVCLVFALAITIERAIVLFGKASINKDAFLRGLKKHTGGGHRKRATNAVPAEKKPPLPGFTRAGMMNVPKGEEEVQAALD